MESRKATLWSAHPAKERSRGVRYGGRGFVASEGEHSYKIDAKHSRQREQLGVGVALTVGTRVPRMVRALHSVFYCDENERSDHPHKTSVLP